MFLSHFSSLTPDKPAIICKGQVLSYAELWERVQERSRQLSDEGLREGQPYDFVMSQDVDSIVTYCAVQCCGASSILYTTGTTGSAKGVIISAKAWTANAENLIDRLGFTSDLVFIICGPLNHLGCLSKIFPTLMTGGTLYILEGLKDLNAFFEPFNSSHLSTFNFQLSTFTKFATFLVPSGIRMLMQFASKQLSAVSHRIDFIETGAAPISQHDMEQLCQLLPQTRLFNTYASTETGIVCSYEFSRYGCQPGVVGKPMKHSSVRIVEDGSVICSGDTLMSGYVGSPSGAPCPSEIHTSDIGFLDEDGMLHLEGRSDDIINVGGYKVNPSEVEDVALAFEGVRDCICIPAPHPLLGTAPKLLYVPKEKVKDLNGENVKNLSPFNLFTFSTFLRSRLEPYKVPLFYEAVPSIKRTYNGKLDRKAYR